MKRLANATTFYGGLTGQGTNRTLHRILPVGPAVAGLSTRNARTFDSFAHLMESTSEVLRRYTHCDVSERDNKSAGIPSQKTNSRMVQSNKFGLNCLQGMQSLPKRTIDRIRVLLIIAAVCSLTLSLATRFSVLTAPRSHTAKSFDSRSAEPKRQNLDRDATRLATPIRVSAPFTPALIASHIVDIQPPASTHIFPSSLFNRPPPAFI
jgi:hypothetical protein